MGECPVACGGDAGDTCAEDQYCKREDGDCGDDVEGVCTDRPGPCQEVLDPVCGCDGNTYDNACVANSAGVNIEHTGACTGAACGGDTGNSCNEGEFCKAEVGACGEDAEGVCTVMPGACPLDQDPVCGCDGTTYANACFAEGAGVTVAHGGECEDGNACGGDTGNTCEDGQFCKTEGGACGEDVEGVCTDLPGACPSTYIPVCGCDGTTYSNDCFAHSAGISVAHDGPCEEGAACGGSGGATCAEGEFCRPALGDCSEGAEGHCTPNPPVCPLSEIPVCGCDDTTYANACLALAAGVGVSHNGPCEGDQQTCDGAEGGTCGEGQFCRHPAGDCSTETEGVCKSIPAVCPAIVDPVCGCDGTTYSSACVADGAGVNVSHDGACEDEQSCTLGDAKGCAEGQYCKGPQGACTDGGEGVCTSMPGVCQLILDPVCGCDGTTYDNACFAAGAGVNVNHAGACAR